MSLDCIILSSDTVKVSSNSILMSLDAILEYLWCSFCCVWRTNLPCRIVRCYGRRQKIPEPVGFKNLLSVCRREMIKFLDPKSEFWAREEAARLLAQADRNADSQLSLTELLAASELFLASKLVNAEQSFHAEF